MSTITRAVQVLSASRSPATSAGRRRTLALAFVVATHDRQMGVVVLTHVERHVSHPILDPIEPASVTRDA